MPTHLLAHWLILTVGFLIAAGIVPGFKVNGFASAVIAAALFGVLNFFIGHVFFVMLGLATLGVGFILAFLTRLVVNAVLLKITDAMTDRLTITGFGPALLGAVVISVVGAVGDWMLPFHGWVR